MTIQLGLPPHFERQSDPYEVFSVLSCGATAMAWWLGGERTAIAMDGSEWHEPITAILILKRILEERGAMAREDRTREFPPVNPSTSPSRTEKVCALCGARLAGGSPRCSILRTTVSSRGPAHFSHSAWLLFRTLPIRQGKTRSRSEGRTKSSRGP